MNFCRYILKEIENSNERINFLWNSQDYRKQCFSSKHLSYIQDQNKEIKCCNNCKFLTIRGKYDVPK